MMDEHLSQVRGKEWLEELFNFAGLTVEVTTEAIDARGDGSCWLIIDSSQLTPEQVQCFLGDGGSTLDAIQYLINATLNIGQPKEQQLPYTIELDGYRVRRQAELKAMAEEAVEQVRSTGQEFEMAALSSAERRQVHTFLKEFEDLETYSRGQEPDRRLVVRPVQEESISE